MTDPSPFNRVHCGDAYNVLRTLPRESVHCVVTSPPYWTVRDYSTAGQLGMEPLLLEYVEKLVAIFRKLRRVLRSDGTCWINLGDTYQNGTLCGVPWRVALALQADGWYLRSDIVWHKPNPMPQAVTGHPTEAHEYLFLFSKSSAYFYDRDAIREKTGKECDPAEYEQHLKEAEEAWYQRSTNPFGDGKKSANKRSITHPLGRNKRTVWTIPTRPYDGAHFSTFPSELVAPCIKAGTSDAGCCSRCGRSWGRIPDYRETRFQPVCRCEAPSRPCVVLDPFAGSGTTPAVAKELGRDWIAVEINPEYVPMIEGRIASVEAAQAFRSRKPHRCTIKPVKIGGRKLL